MSKSIAELASMTPDEDIELVRELLVYDVQCPLSCKIERGQYDNLLIKVAPSPFHWSRQVEWPWCLNKAELEPYHVCLDVGSGWSVLKYAIAERCKRVFAVDNSRESVQKTQHSIDKLGFGDRVFQSVADARDLPWPDCHFDRVFCVSVMEHIDGGHERAVNEAIRVLKPGGYLLLTMDVVFEGVPGKSKNFYVDAGGATELLRRLSIPLETVKTEKAIASKVKSDKTGDDVSVFILMIRYQKPEGK